MAHHNILHSNADHYLTFLKHVPPKFEVGDDTYSLMNGLLTDVENTRVENGYGCNPFDLLLSSRYDARSNFPGVSWDVGILYDRVSFILVGKSHQNALLNQAAAGLKNFHHIKCWNMMSTAELEDHHAYVLKPEMGARGIGQILFRNGRISLEQIDQAILASHSQEGFLNSLKDLPDWRYVVGREHKSDEGYGLLKEHRVVSEYVHNVEYEYRVITNANSQVGCVVTRKRIAASEKKEDCDVPTYYQATGSDGEIGKTFVGELDKITAVEVTPLYRHREEIAAFLAAIDLPLHSFDFFVTADDKWGVFEFNQTFGTNTVPVRFLREEGCKLLSYYCTGQKA